MRGMPGLLAVAVLGCWSSSTHLGATDADGYFDTFQNLTPGTVVRFLIILRNDAVPPTAVDQVFTIFIQVIGDGITVLDEKPVVIIVPHTGSSAKGGPVG